MLEPNSNPRLESTSLRPESSMLSEYQGSLIPCLQHNNRSCDDLRRDRFSELATPKCTRVHYVPNSRSTEAAALWLGIRVASIFEYSSDANRALPFPCWQSRASAAELKHCWHNPVHSNLRDSFCETTIGATWHEQTHKSGSRMYFSPLVMETRVGYKL